MLALALASLTLSASLALPLREITVRPVGPVPTLAAALRLARTGDTVTVLGGTYPTDGTILNVPGLLLRGRGWPVLDGEGRHEILVITADDVTVTGFILRGAGVSMVRDQAAIRVIETHGCRVVGNRMVDGFFGVYLQRATGCRIAGNEIHGTGGNEAQNGNGIHLWNATDIAIDSNVVDGHRDGIYLEFSHRVTAVGNRSTRNRRYGLHFMFSDDCRYRDNTFVANGAGVAVMYSRTVTLERTLFSDATGPSAN